MNLSPFGLPVEIAESATRCSAQDRGDRERGVISSSYGLEDLEANETLVVTADDALQTRGSMAKPGRRAPDPA